MYKIDRMLSSNVSILRYLASVSLLSSGNTNSEQYVVLLSTNCCMPTKERVYFMYIPWSLEYVTLKIYSTVLQYYAETV